MAESHFGGEPIIMAFLFINNSMCNWKQTKKKNGESYV